MGELDRAYLWISLYVLWLGLVVGAAYGTGKSLPIAGAGLVAKHWQENTARTLISVGSIGVRRRDSGSPRPMALERLNLFDSPDFGGPFRARTGDPLIKSQLLYQLS